MLFFFRAGWWSDVELESLLKGTSLLEEVRASREEAVADWRALRPAWAAEYATHPLWAVSQDDGAREFKWAEASVRSRADGVRFYVEDSAVGRWSVGFDLCRTRTVESVVESHTLCSIF